MTRQDSEIFKGIAILLMLWHHLFGLPSLVAPENDWRPLLPGIPVEYLIGRFGKICVGIFLFLSGYGFATKGRTDWFYRRGKIKAFLQVYWIVFAVFVPIGLIFFWGEPMKGGVLFTAEPTKLVLNLLTLRTDYNYEWWFAETYLLLILTLPVFLWLADRAVLACIAGGAAFVAGAGMDVLHLNPPFISVSNLMIWQLPFLTGALVARSQIWTKMSSSSVLVVVSFTVLAGGFTAVEIAAPWAMTPFLIVATPLAMVILMAFRTVLGRFAAPLSLFGRNSLMIWLIHTFHCYYFAQNFIYAPRLSVLIFANLLLASLVSSITLKNLHQILAQRYHKFRAKAQE